MPRSRAHVASHLTMLLDRQRDHFFLGTFLLPKRAWPIVLVMSPNWSVARVGQVVAATSFKTRHRAQGCGQGWEDMLEDWDPQWLTLILAREA